MGFDNRHDAERQSVLIVGDGARARELRERLAEQHYDVVGMAETAASASVLFDSKRPQVVVLHLSPHNLEAARAIPALLEQRRVPMIAVSDSSSHEMIDAACAACACGFVMGSSVSGEALSAQIQVSLSRFNAFEKLMAEKAEIAQDLEQRKYLDRAKAILIKRTGLTEPEAHRRLQKESQRRRLSLAEVARRVVETEEMLEGGS